MRDFFLLSTKKNKKTHLFNIVTVYVFLDIPFFNINKKVKQINQVNFFKSLDIPIFFTVFLIGKTKIITFLKFLVSTFFYLSSSLFYETNQRFQILRSFSINSFSFLKTQNSNNSFKKKQLSKYNRKSEYYKRLGTYTNFYFNEYNKIKRHYATSVIFDHKFLTSEDVKLLKTFYKLKKIFFLLNYFQ